MSPNEKSKFAQLIRDVMSYYKQDYSEFILNLWWSGLINFDYEVISKALSAHATDPDQGKFAPKIADIVKILQGSTTDKANTAWSKVYEAIKGIGSYNDVVFDDPAIHATIDDMGGWLKMCQSTTEDLGYLQHNFCKTYQTYAKKQNYTYSKIMRGLRSPDEEFEKKGLDVPPPIVVGNIDSARLVYRGGSSTGINMMTLGVTLQQTKAITDEKG